MSAIVLLVALFFTTVLTDMPKAVLGAIVFLIGLDLIDIAGLRRIARRRRSEFVIAVRDRCRRVRGRHRAGHHPRDRGVDHRGHPPSVRAPRLRARRLRDRPAELQAGDSRQPRANPG